MVAPAATAPREQAAHARAWFALAVALYLAMSAVLARYYYRIPPSPDQSLFDYMAWLDLHGRPLFRGSFDMTWPAPLVVHELGVIMFGVHPWTSRLADYLYLQLGVAALFGFARAYGFRRAAWIALFAYPLIYVTSGPWMAGHRDIVAMHWLILAAALPSRGWRAAVLVGLCCGVAVATRPTYLAFAPLIVLASMLARPFDWRAGLRQGTGIAVGVALIVLGFVLVGALRGALNAWFEASFLFVGAVYAAHHSLGEMLASMAGTLRDLWWLTLAGLFGTLVLVAGRGLSQPLARIIVLLIVVLVSYFVQNKGFGYHLGGLIPLLTLLAAIGIDVAWSRVPRPAFLAGGVMIALVLATGLAARTRNEIVPVVLHGRVPARNAERDTMVHIITQESRPDDTVYQFGWNFDVVFLAQRRSPTRLVNATVINMIDRRSGRFTGWMDELHDDLTRRAPRFLLLDLTDPPGGVPALKGTLAREAVGDAIRRGYSVRATTPTMQLFERRDPVPR